MGERTSYPAGTFSWADLATTDSEGAKAFYGGVFGWELEEMPVPEGPPYVMARIDGKSVAALYERGADVPGPPAWLSYVTVDDADATAARAGELGATTISEPFDVVDAGRMAVLQDPTGAMFAVWQARTSIGAELVNDPGAMTMNQHNTGDPAAAQAFYEGLFGWGFETVAEGDQPFWSIYNGGRLNGGMMPLPTGGGVPPHWLVYFTTLDLDGSVARVTEGGGRVVVEPMSVPSGRFAVTSDPHSAVFGLFEGEVDP
jgi:predicted enzyme related to lactoylglutathione lyase